MDMSSHLIETLQSKLHVPRVLRIRGARSIERRIHEIEDWATCKPNTAADDQSFYNTIQQRYFQVFNIFQIIFADYLDEFDHMINRDRRQQPSTSSRAVIDARA